MAVGSEADAIHLMIADDPEQNLFDASLSFTAEGFEIGVHIDTGCANYTLTGLEDYYNAQLAADFAKDIGGADQVFTATISDETEADLIAAYREANPSD